MIEYSLISKISITRAHCESEREEENRPQIEISLSLAAYGYNLFTRALFHPCSLTPNICLSPKRVNYAACTLIRKCSSEPMTCYTHEQSTRLLHLHTGRIGFTSASIITFDTILYHHHQHFFTIEYSLWLMTHR